MPYLNFTKITPPAPNDPVVNEVTQINNNWDHIDTKLNPYINGGTLSGLEAGQELFGSGFEFTVWDGAAGRNPDDIDSFWSAWTALPILAPRVTSPAIGVKWRNNSKLRMVELSGGVLFDAAAAAWTMGSLFTVTAQVAGGIPASMIPIGNEHRSPCATALPDYPASVTVGGYVIVDRNGAESFLRIRTQYLAGSGGGNFLMLDQVSWWY